MNFLIGLLSKMSIKKVEKKNLIKEVMEDPEEFMIEAFVENDEIIFKIKRKES